MNRDKLDEVLHSLVVTHAVINGVITRIQGWDSNTNPLLRSEMIVDLQGIRKDVATCFESLRALRFEYPTKTVG